MNSSLKRGLLVGGACFVLGVAVGGGFVYKLHDEHLSDDKPEAVARAFSPVPFEDAAPLAERFRPWLRFDSGEPWRPVSLDAFFEERNAQGQPAQRMCSRPPAPSECGPVASEADFEEQVAASSAFGASSYLDIAGEKVADYRAPDTSECPGLSDCGEEPESAIYYRVTSSNNRFYVDYWWFLRYNHFEKSIPQLTCLKANDLCGEHEGDWEGVTVVTPPGDDTRPDYVVYAAHDGTFRYAASELALRDEARPEVFVARGSHAAYPRPCDSGCLQPAPLAVKDLLTLPEGNSDGKGEWARNGDDCPPGPTSCLRPLPRPEVDPTAWTAWPGLWGETCSSRCGRSSGPQSPQSPGLQKRYQAPWCSNQGELLTCDGVAQTCTDWLGPLVAAVACTPQTLSDALRAPNEHPPGDLSLALHSRGEVDATTPGIVQLLREPLEPGDRLTVSGPAATGIQLLVRARVGRYQLDARFDKLRLAGGSRRIEIAEHGGKPTARLLGTSGRHADPIERRVVRLPRLPAGA